MVRIAIVGLGKMGLSHYAIANVHPDVQVTAICDSAKYTLDVLHKYTEIPVYTDYSRMLAESSMDAIIIATPSNLHASMVEKALELGLGTFCEKPFCLNPGDAERLTSLAANKHLVSQVGYHHRFIASFQEAKRLLDLGAIGKVTHVLAEAYGPVVLKPKGATWRMQSKEGGGCLYDYAAHPINLLNWFFGMPSAASGSVLGKTFSRDTEDQVYATLYFDADITAHVSVDWSDESHRKMSTKISVWGTNGRIVADRQECQVYMRRRLETVEGYTDGWNVRYTTELTNPTWFYLRGEEYSSQIDYFVKKVKDKSTKNINSFAASAQTDAVISMIAADANRPDRVGSSASRTRR